MQEQKKVNYAVFERILSEYKKKQKIKRADIIRYIILKLFKSNETNKGQFGVIWFLPMYV